MRKDDRKAVAGCLIYMVILCASLGLAFILAHTPDRWFQEPARKWYPKRSDFRRLKPIRYDHWWQVPIPHPGRSDAVDKQLWQHLRDATPDEKEEMK
jgi:hypothetical protein